MTRLESEHRYASTVVVTFEQVAELRNGERAVARRTTRERPALFGTVTFLAVLDWTARFSRISHTAVHGPVSPQPLGDVPALAAAGTARAAA